MTTAPSTSTLCSATTLRSPPTDKLAIDVKHINPLTSTLSIPREYTCEHVLRQPLPAPPSPCPNEAKRAKAKYLDKWHHVIFILFQFTPTCFACFLVGTQWGFLVYLVSSLSSNGPWFTYYFLGVLGTVLWLLMVDCIVQKTPASDGDRWTSNLLYPGVYLLVFLSLIVIYAMCRIELENCLYEAPVDFNSPENSFKSNAIEYVGFGYIDSLSTVLLILLMESNWTTTYPPTSNLVFNLPSSKNATQVPLTNNKSIDERLNFASRSQRQTCNIESKSEAVSSAMLMIRVLSKVQLFCSVLFFVSLLVSACVTMRLHWLERPRLASLRTRITRSRSCWSDSISFRLSPLWLVLSVFLWPLMVKNYKTVKVFGRLH